MYGAQTKKVCDAVKSVFENDVEMYGAQTDTENDIEKQ